MEDETLGHHSGESDPEDELEPDYVIPVYEEDVDAPVHHILLRLRETTRLSRTTNAAVEMYIPDLAKPEKVTAHRTQKASSGIKWLLLSGEAADEKAVPLKDRRKADWKLSQFGDPITREPVIFDAVTKPQVLLRAKMKHPAIKTSPPVPPKGPEPAKTEKKTAKSGPATPTKGGETEEQQIITRSSGQKRAAEASAAEAAKNKETKNSPRTSPRKGAAKQNLADKLGSANLG